MIRTDNVALRSCLQHAIGSRIYMASPFTVYPTKEMAWRDACRAAAALQACTPLAVYSPIADSYGVEAIGGAKLTHADWMIRDHAMLLACQVVVVVMLPGWERSKGIAQEIEWAHEAKLPVYYVQPVSQHDSGAYAIGSMEAGPDEGYPALPLFHPDLMREAWTAPMHDDPYAGEKTLQDVLEGLTEIHLPAGTPVEITGRLGPWEPAIRNAPGTKGGGAF